MQHILDMLDSMKRPCLLIQAARLGMHEYRREVHLRRHLGTHTLPRSGEALHLLADIEAGLNEARKTNAAGYSPTRHVDVLIAMMSEARILRAASITTG